MEAYLDNAATTKPFEEVKNVVIKLIDEDYGNPSSVHIKGYKAERYMVDAREEIAKSMKVDAKEIFFTSGGTESNNLALMGTALANKRLGNHIIATCFEHPSVYNTLINLENFGFKITYVPVDNLGHVNIEKLIDEIGEDTILISIMMVNNEIGSVQNIEEIIKKVKSKKKDILFHVDAIQAFGKYRIYPKRLGIDLMSISGHKIHASKGVGALYIKDKVKVKPIIFGGEQEKGIRSGTENVPAIAGFGEAVKKIYTDFDNKIDRMYKLKEKFISKVSTIDGVVINGIQMTEEDLEKSIRESAPHIVSVSFKGVKSEAFLHALEDKGVYVSSGSACASNHPQISSTLKAIGVEKNLLDCTLRFSFSMNTNVEEIDYTVKCIKELLPVLRKYYRK